LSECSEEMVEEALQLLREALENYLRSNCRKILSLAKAAGQERLRIELYGLFRYFSPSENFPRFMHAFEYASRCSSEDRLREALAFEEMQLDEEDERLSKLVYRVETIEGLCRELEA